MPLDAGARLGPYEIVSPIGKGGMGEVYRARDTKLERDVAIKVLPDELAADEERVVRFEREAKLLASLNHPNIASIYGIESGALVLELVEGPTLAEEIERGSIPVNEAIAIATQIADALEAGHEAGVIHRDLKPANIKRKEDGTVKVLDYGLAKAFEGESSGVDTDLSQSPTLTRQGTQVGVILGTAAYMSPEQAKGKRVDKRTDVWAFGVVLYEMLTGEKAFAGEGVSDVLAAVIKSEPDWERLPGGTYAGVERVLRRCLRKDPAHRIRDVGDARMDLVEAGSSSTEERSATLAPAFWQQPKWLALAAFALAAMAWFAGSTRSENATRDEAVVRYAVTLPDTDVLNMITGGLALSNDGRRLAYVANRDGVKQLYVRERDQVAAALVPGTEGADTPFFSPDGEWLAFFQGASLMKVSLAGGAPQLVGHATRAWESRGASWGVNGTIVVGGLPAALSFPAAGGDPEALKAQAEYFPFFLPDGESVLLQSLDSHQVFVHHLASGEERLLLDGEQPRVVSDYLIVVRERSLWAAPFDVERARVTGPAVPVIDGVTAASDWNGSSYGVTADGALAFVPTDPAGALVVVDPAGGSTELTPLEMAYHSLRLSPDGRRVVGDSDDFELWVYAIGAGTRHRVATGGIPSWSPDGASIVYGAGSSTRDLRVAIKAADGTGDERVLLRGDQVGPPSSWSPDGAWIAFDRPERQRPDDNFDIYLSSPTGETKPLLATPATERSAVFSPDGRWIAYQSDESGRAEIYVEPFPGPGERVAVSARGGTTPLWRPDGSELYYRQDTAVMAVSVEAGEDLSFGPPRQMVDGPYWLDASGHVTYGVFPDGKLLLIDTGQANEIHVVLNWDEELKRLVARDD